MRPQPQERLSLDTRLTTRAYFQWRSATPPSSPCNSLLRFGRFALSLRCNPTNFRMLWMRLAIDLSPPDPASRRRRKACRSEGEDRAVKRISAYGRAREIRPRNSAGPTCSRRYHPFPRRRLFSLEPPRVHDRFFPANAVRTPRYARPGPGSSIRCKAQRSAGAPRFGPMIPPQEECGVKSRLSHAGPSIV